MTGYRTYLSAAAMALAALAYGLGWLSREEYEMILGFLGSLGLAALRAGVKAGK